MKTKYIYIYLIIISLYLWLVYFLNFPEPILYILGLFSFIGAYLNRKRRISHFDLIVGGAFFLNLAVWVIMILFSK